VLWIKGLTVILLVQGRWEIAVRLAVTAVLLHPSAKDKGIECNVVCTG